MKTTINNAMVEYNKYVVICGMIGEEPVLLEGDFLLSEEQQREFKAYSKECERSNETPVLADFLLGDISQDVRYQMELQKRTAGLDPSLFVGGLKLKAFSVAAGR